MHLYAPHYYGGNGIVGAQVHVYSCDTLESRVGEVSSFQRVLCTGFNGVGT